MTLDEKLGQLFVAPFSPMRGEDHWADWERLLDECHIGHAIVKASDPKTQVLALNRLQQRSRTPLLILADAEWGLGMRMSETISFPRNLTLGAVSDLTPLEDMGYWIAVQAKRVGIHLNLAPVVDVNNHPLNPVIHVRSFGEDQYEVSHRAAALICGMQRGGLMSCAKHFPGHGDTTVDSHVALPLLTHSLARIHAVELVPFQAAIAAGVDSIMSAHLQVPAIDDLPTSLSKRCMSDLLREELGFKGLVVSDALNMRALTETRSIEEIALLAYAAGNDLLLFGAHLLEDVDLLLRDLIPRAYAALREAFVSGRFSEAELDERVGRILAVKSRCSFDPLPIPASMFDPEALALKRELFRSALTQIGQPLPAEIPATYLAVGGSEDDWIVRQFKELGFKVQCIDLNQPLPSMEQPYLIGLHRVKSVKEQFGLSLDLKQALRQSAAALLFCTPYAVQLFTPGTPVLVAYENEQEAQEAAFDALFGKLQPTGSLPVFKTIDF